MAWQLCSECTGCPASYRDREKCRHRYEEEMKEQAFEAMIAERERWDAAAEHHYGQKEDEG